MALTKQTIIDQITADAFGNVNVRTRTDILEGKEVISTSYHRHVVGVEDDLKGEDKRVQAIAIAARKDALPQKG